MRILLEYKKFAYEKVLQTLSSIINSRDSQGLFHPRICELFLSHTEINLEKHQHRVENNIRC